MPGPETPPRYRYTKSVSDDEDEAKAHGDATGAGKVADKAVLASKKRSGSLGRPLCMSRVLDRQRHGGEGSQPLQPEPQGETRRIRGWSEAPGSHGRRVLQAPSEAPGPSNRFVLQAPPLLTLGQLQAPLLPDPLNSARFGIPGTNVPSVPVPNPYGGEGSAVRPPAFMMGPIGNPNWSAPSGPFPFQPTTSFDLTSASAASASRRSLSAGRSFPSAPPALLGPQFGTGMMGMNRTPRAGYPGYVGLQQPQGLNLCHGALSVPTPTRAQRGSEERSRHERRINEDRREHEHRGGIFSNGSFSEARPTVQIRPPKGPNVGDTFTERPEPVDETRPEAASTSTANCRASPAIWSNSGPQRETMHSHKDSAETAGTSASGGSLWSSNGSFAAPETCQQSRPVTRVLVTGATGLLGRQVMQLFSSTNWEVCGLCKSRAQAPRILSCDLIQEDAFWHIMQGFQPQVVLHIAAEWRPEVLRQSPEQARKLNVDAAGTVAAACEKFKAWLVHLSADCVFDGTKPPYSVESRPNPLSEYGWQKLHSEQLVRAACPSAAVLRVPLLYGPVESPLDSAVTSLYTDLRTGIREVDAWQCCYPTWAGDVAQVLKVMVELHFSGERLQGIYHWQGSEQFTWHEMMLLVAETTGLDASGITAVSSPPSTPLPRDTRLECSRLHRLLGQEVENTSLQKGLSQCLAPFRQAPAMAGQIAVKPRPKTPSKVEWKALPRASKGTPCKGLLSDLKGQNAALQEIFWEELERTRARLQQAGINRKRCASEKLTQDQAMTNSLRSGRLDEQRV